MFIIVFILTILILVVIHELGHFFAAKFFGIKVLEFGFGIPPKAWGKKWGETLISLNWLPFGGFVRLLGEDDTDKEALENKRSFASQKPWKKIIVVIAGVVMNLLLAWLIYYVVLSLQNFQTKVPLLTNHKFVGVEQTNEKIVVIGDVAPDSPAQKAGLERGDRITSINGEAVSSSEQLINKTRDHAGQVIKLVLEDVQTKEQRTIEVTPRVDPPAGQGALGVALGSFNVANLEYKTPLQKAFSGPIHGYNLAIYSFDVLGNTLKTAINNKDLKPVSQNVAGPVGITSIVKDILSSKNPLLPYLDFMAALSLNLAVINILPFPGLDGGRLFFLIIEAITHKKTPAVIEKYVHTVGLALLIGLILLITASDIRKLF
jgi:regulator of sigma E protease